MGVTKITKLEIQRIIKPICRMLISSKHRPVITGLQGGQGTGKTTFGKVIKKELQKAGYKVQSFSIDDFYATDAQRHRLARKYPKNPYYQIARGLPGTHRVSVLHKTLQDLKAGRSTELPVFDKSLHRAHGDVTKKTIKVKGKQDFILFEGWCVGVPYTSAAQVDKICKKNRIKLRKMDPTLRHTKVVLEKVKKYLKVWDYLDYLIMLKPNSPTLHTKWRYKQEQQLKKRTGIGMSKKQIDQFVQPYLPFTYLCYETLKPDARVFISERHEYYRIENNLNSK